jgi:hypothetical protein
VREPEGIAMPPPGKSSERTWSKYREPYVRIVEVGGSSPLTSTNKGAQVTGPAVNPPKDTLSKRRPRIFTCLYGQCLCGLMSLFTGGGQLQPASTCGGRRVNFMITIELSHPSPLLGGWTRVVR